MPLLSTIEAKTGLSTVLSLLCRESGGARLHGFLISSWTQNRWGGQARKRRNRSQWKQEIWGGSKLRREVDLVRKVPAVQSLVHLHGQANQAI